MQEKGLSYFKWVYVIIVSVKYSIDKPLIDRVSSDIPTIILGGTLLVHSFILIRTCVCLLYSDKLE